MDDKAEQLTALLAADLEAGFTELVRVHAGTVHAFLHRVTGSSTEADDLGQDTFLRAYTALQGYSPARRRDLRPRAWLMTIAANVWRNHVRTRTRRPAVTGLPVEETVDIWPDGTPGPEERAETTEDRTRLVTALSALPERHRIPVVLHHVAGLSYAEVAEIQGCAVGTAKAQVSRGIGSLRRLLEQGPTATREVTK